MVVKPLHGLTIAVLIALGTALLRNALVVPRISFLSAPSLYDVSSFAAFESPCDIRSVFNGAHVGNVLRSCDERRRTLETCSSKATKTVVPQMRVMTWRDEL